MKKKFMCMLMAAAMTLSMAACGSKSDDTNTDANTDGTDNAEVQTFKLGSSGPLTGDSAIYGMAVVQGAELAVNEINASDSKIKFEFQKQDDEADGEKSVSLADIATKSQVNNTIPVDVTATYSSPVSPPPYMVGMVEIELDKETGSIEILDYQSVIDCGIPVNPNLARVQAVSYTHLTLPTT